MEICKSTLSLVNIIGVKFDPHNQSIILTTTQFLQPPSGFSATYHEAVVPSSLYDEAANLLDIAIGEILWLLEKDAASPAARPEREMTLIKELNTL